jgi:hypothetical protein
MRAGLAAKQRVDAPSAVNPNLNSADFKSGVQRDNIRTGHIARPSGHPVMHPAFAAVSIRLCRADLGTPARMPL